MHCQSLHPLLKNVVLKYRVITSDPFPDPVHSESLMHGVVLYFLLSNQIQKKKKVRKSLIFKKNIFQIKYFRST